MSESVEVTLDRIWEEARQKRRQAERIEDACKQLAVLFGVKWSPPTPENVDSPTPKDGK